MARIVEVLTDRTVKSAKPSSRTSYISDGDGLHLVVDTAGSKTWMVRLWKSGKETRAGLGTYPDVSLASARERARDAREGLRMSGQTPADIKRVAQAAKRAQNAERVLKEASTFLNAATRWHESLPTSMNEKHRAQCISTLNQFVFPALGTRRLDDINPGDILDEVLTPMLENRVNGKANPLIETASRALQRIDSVYQFAGLRGLCSTNPAALCRKAFARRKKEALKIKPKAHFPAIDLKELGELLRSVHSYEPLSPQTSLALQFIAYTAVRSGEIRGATWDEFGLRSLSPTWTIPAPRMKARREHIVPLSRQAVAALKRLKKEAGDSDLVLPGRGDSSKPISDMALSMAIRRMGYAGRHTVHGFRAVFSTLARERSQFRRDAIETQLAHSVANPTEAAYNRAQFIDERRKLMQWYADELDQIRG